MIPDAAVEAAAIHFTYMTSPGFVVAVCAASSRFDVRFRSSDKREEVTCPDCLKHTEATHGND